MDALEIKILIDDRMVRPYDVYGLKKLTEENFKDHLEKEVLVISKLRPQEQFYGQIKKNSNEYYIDLGFAKHMIYINLPHFKYIINPIKTK